MTIANPGTCRRIGLWPNLGLSVIAGLSATGDCNHSQDIRAAAGIKGAPALEIQPMRLLFHSVRVAASLVLAPAAFAQTAPVSAPAVAEPADSAVAVPVALGKRMACLDASQSKQGQDKKDQMQLCMEQARLDCLKQAIEQKIVGPQRKDFVKSCME